MKIKIKKNNKDFIRSLDRAVKLFLVFLLIFSAASCSVVFSSSLKGSIIDEDANGINGAAVFLYTEESGYVEDLGLLSGVTLVTDSVVNSLNNYYKKTISETEGGDDGIYNFNGVYWETGFAEFGKDGDRHIVYLIILDEDYSIKTYETILVSSVTNSEPAIELDRLRQSVTIKGSVLDASSNEGVANVNLSVYIPESWEYDGTGNVVNAVYDDEADYVATTDDNGEYTLSVSFFNTNTDEGSGKVELRITFDKNNYIIDDTINSGTLTLDTTDFDNDGETDDFYYQSDTIQKDKTYSLDTIYAKKTHFEETVDGRVLDSSLASTDQGVNGKKVLIWVDVLQTDPAPDPTSNEPDFVTYTNIREITTDTYQNGYFSFDSISWDDDTYTGNQSTVWCWIAVYEADDESYTTPLIQSKVQVYSDSDNYFELTY